jgi:hypothetical protein
MWQTSYFSFPSMRSKSTSLICAHIRVISNVFRYKKYIRVLTKINKLNYVIDLMYLGRFSESKNNLDY